MNDRPTAPELVGAVRHFLEKELIPTLTDPRIRFQTLIAANVLAIIGRELIGEHERLLEEAQWLARALSLPVPISASTATLQTEVIRLNAQLCDRIHAGDYDKPHEFRELSRQLRRTVEQKLEIANPRYLASCRETT